MVHIWCVTRIKLLIILITVRMTKQYLLIALKHVILSLAFLCIVDYFGALKHCLELDFIMFHYPMHKNALQNSRKARFNRSLGYPLNTYINFILNPVHKCYKEGIPRPKLIVLVKSATINFDRRSAIRETWGSEAEYHGIVQTVFLLGSTNSKDIETLVQNENEKFSDIVKAKFWDSYNNNTIKTIMGLQWAVENCEQSPYFMFVDDDYFVSIKNVLIYVNNFFFNNLHWSLKRTRNISKENSPSTTRNERSGTRDSGFSHLSIDNTTKTLEDRIKMDYQYNLKRSRNCLKLFAGFVIKSSPHRHKFSKWYIGLSEYPFDMWPPYVTAGAYILSRESLTELFFMSMFTKIFKYDDIYLGILALKANISVTHCSKFYFEKATYSRPHDYKYVIASHGYGNPKEMVKTWSECRSAGYT